MKWMTQDDVPDAFGPKQYGDPTQTNWAITRYVPWSSWASVVDDLAERRRATRRSRARARAWAPTPTS